jgi:hypothetical protein
VAVSWAPRPRCASSRSRRLWRLPPRFKLSYTIWCMEGFGIHQRCCGFQDMTKKWMKFLATNCVCRFSLHDNETLNGYCIPLYPMIPSKRLPGFEVNLKTWTALESCDIPERPDQVWNVEFKPYVKLVISRCKSWSYIAISCFWDCQFVVSTPTTYDSFKNNFCILFIDSWLGWFAVLSSLLAIRTKFNPFCVCSTQSTCYYGAFMTGNSNRNAVQ